MILFIHAGILFIHTAVPWGMATGHVSAMFHMMLVVWIGLFVGYQLEMDSLSDLGDFGEEGKNLNIAP